MNEVKQAERRGNVKLIWRQTVTQQITRILYQRLSNAILNLMLDEYYKELVFGNPNNEQPPEIYSKGFAEVLSDNIPMRHGER